MSVLGRLAGGGDNDPGWWGECCEVKLQLQITVFEFVNL